MRIGEAISFGAYEGQVLAVKGHRALLLTRDTIGLSAFHNKPGESPWANSEMRSYLNATFYPRFSAEDSARIVQVPLQNQDNPWFDARGGEETCAPVFLLSIEEAVCRSFCGSSENPKVPNRKSKYWFTRKEENNEKRRAEYLHCPGWRLRSPGRKQAKGNERFLRTAVQGHADRGAEKRHHKVEYCGLLPLHNPLSDPLPFTSSLHPYVFLYCYDDGFIRGGACLLRSDPSSPQEEKPPCAYRQPHR